ncbi:hypothetical protein D3C76_249010 [compost metagenome]
MSWSLLLLLFLLVVPVLETPQLARLHSPRDMAVFYMAWLIALAATLADMAGWTQIRPLDWISSLMQLLSI